MEEVMDNVTVKSDRENLDCFNSSYVLEPVPTREFTLMESVFAWFCLLFGYLFCRVFPVVSSPLGGFLFILFVYVSTTIILKIKKVEFGVISIVTAVSAIIISATLVFSSNSLLHFYAYIYALATYFFYIQRAMGNYTQKAFSDLILLDYFKALFKLPFTSLGNFFKAMFYGKAREGGKVIARLLLGIAIAIIPTGIVISLLSYDSGFSSIMGNMLDFSFGNIFSHTISLLIAIPIGDYVFGAFISSVDKKNSNILSVEEFESRKEERRVAPVLTVLVAVVPLLVVYIIFFVSQWKYYISGFTGNLPEGVSYAQYAREGFFQLCTVSVINLIVILLVTCFMNMEKKYGKVILKSLSIVFSVFTLILISTAIAKMAMYIECYGLTPKRVYSTWFMIVLTIIFILIIVKQFVPKLNALAASMSVFIVMFAVMALSNVDGFIARYNINRYLDGSLKKLDVYALAKLGDEAVPEMVRLAEEFEKIYHTNIVDINDSYEVEDRVYYRLAAELGEIAKDFEKEEKDFFSYTIPYIRAKQALERIGLIN